MERISWLSVEMLDSQEEHCAIEFFGYLFGRLFSYLVSYLVTELSS